MIIQKLSAVRSTRYEASNFYLEDETGSSTLWYSLHLGVLIPTVCA